MVGGGLEPDLGGEIGAASVNLWKIKGDGGLLFALEGSDSHLKVWDDRLAVFIVADESSSGRGSALVLS